jgi:hypothetical protein
VPTRAPPTDTAALTTVDESVETTLLKVSLMLTCGCVVKAEPDAVPIEDRIRLKPEPAPATPVAVNVTGEPDSDPEVAETVFAPAAVPSVHAGAVATPEELDVTANDDASDPPPVATANVTDAPATGLPAASETSTDGAIATALPAVAV